SSDLKAEPIEVREAILDEIEDTFVESFPDGRRAVCNRIRITLLSPDPARRKQLRRALTTEGGLKQFMLSRWAAQIEIPDSLTVQIEGGSSAPDPQDPRE